MMKALATALLAAIVGGCSAHVALLTFDKQADSQEQYIDNYDYEISLMEVNDYE